MQTFAVILVACFLSLPRGALAAEAAIEFTVAGTSMQSMTVSAMTQVVTPRRMTYFDPHYAKQKTMDALPLGPLLSHVFGEHLQQPDLTHVVFVALDGYRAIAPADVVHEPGGYVAFRDPDVPEWEPVGRKQANPGPFYLFWTAQEQSTAQGYPWPWQITAIHLVRFHEAYPKVFPTGVAKNSSVYQGFEIFRQQCFRCHALSDQGGKIGPDLNAPQNILAYRPIGLVKAMIKAPSTFRHTSMPDHPHLTENDLDSLIDFFLFKSRER